MSILPEEIKVLSQYIYTLSGIALDESKGYLLESRLSPLLKQSGTATYSELYFKAKSDATHALSRKIVDAITTGETSFFRDTSPFDLLQHKILPDLIDKRGKTALPGRPVPIRILSLACSTGQEIYSIAIVLKELLADLSRYDVRLMGTDISDAAVAAASRGAYNSIEIERGLPKDKLSRYFMQEGNTWRIRDEIRAMATFRTMNLMEDFRGMGRFDIVLCRNVAIYFKEDDRKRLFTRIGSIMEPDGYLIIGSTESLTGLCPQYEPLRYLRSVYYVNAGAKPAIGAPAALQRA
jgi:chemotaxis protein methyltransferase CheR